jgi:hypothetical protein
MTERRISLVPQDSGGVPDGSRQLADETFRLLVDGVKDYAIFLLSPDGKVVTWNQGRG